MSLLPSPAAILLAAVALGGCTPATVSETERDSVLRAADLAVHGFPQPTGADEETWEARRWLDGSGEVEYRYETLVEGEPAPFCCPRAVCFRTAARGRCQA